MRSIPLLLGLVPAVALATPATGIVRVLPAIVLFLIAALLLGLLVFRKTAQHYAGFLTRRLGRLRLQSALRASSRDALHELRLPGAYDGIAEVDHAILTSGGILCVRALHDSGIVFADSDAPQWTCITDSARRRFLNPLIENAARVKAVEQVLPDVPVANLVVFTGSVQFSAKPPSNVITLDQLDSYIAKFVFGPSKIEDWDAAWLTLKAAALRD